MGINKMNRSSVSKTSSRETIIDRYVQHLESAQKASNLPFGQTSRTKNVAACNQADVNGMPCIADGISGLDLGSLLGCECPEELQGIFVDEVGEEPAQEEAVVPGEELGEIEDTLVFLTEQIQKLQQQLVDEGVENPEEEMESEETEGLEESEDDEPEQECPGDPNCSECGEGTGATEPCADCQATLDSEDSDVDVMSAFFGNMARSKFSAVNINMLKSAALMGPEEKEKIVRIAVDALRNKKNTNEILADLVSSFVPDWVTEADTGSIEGFINFFKECISRAKVITGRQSDHEIIPEGTELETPGLEEGTGGLETAASRKTEWLRRAIKDGVLGS